MNNIMISKGILMLKEYKYLYETHMHTNQASACGANTGREMAKAAKDYGYAGDYLLTNGDDIFDCYGNLVNA